MGPRAGLDGRNISSLPGFDPGPFVYIYTHCVYIYICVCVCVCVYGLEGPRFEFRNLTTGSVVHKASYSGGTDTHVRGLRIPGRKITYIHLVPGLIMSRAVPLLSVFLYSVDRANFIHQYAAHLRQKVSQLKICFFF